MSTKVKVKKKVVALMLSKVSVPQLVADARHYVQSMTGNANFPNPSPTLTDVSANATALEAAYAVAQTKVKGSAEQRDVQVRALHLKLKAMATYVEAVANTNPDLADSVIASAGMQEKKPTTKVPHGFSVKLTTKPGEALLTTKGVKRGAYIYEMSTDPTFAPANWVMIYQGITMKFLKTGLVSGTRYFFRYSTIDKTGQSAWSPVLSVVIQ
jgi:hypothetical protein